MLQILIIIILAWIAVNFMIFALMRSSFERSERLESNRDRLSKQWANQKKFKK